MKSLLRLFLWPMIPVLALTIGCATGPRTKTIQIESDPPGMRIECNGADLGKTPTSHTLATNPEGEFLGSWAHAPVVEFVAYPPGDAAGLYVQRKVFEPNGFFKAGDKIPARIYFDMRRKSERLIINPPNQ